jgi:hypothetical protein
MTRRWAHLAVLFALASAFASVARAQEANSAPDGGVTEDAASPPEKQAVPPAPSAQSPAPPPATAQPLPPSPPPYPPPATPAPPAYPPAAAPPTYPPTVYVAPTYPAPPALGPRPLPPVDRSIQRHDGFYLRIGFGVSHFVSTFKGSATQGSTAPAIEGTGTGTAAALDFALGGTVLPGLVIGGAILQDVSDEMWSRDVTVDGQSALREGQVLEYQLTFAMLGPFVDWYFDDERGFHAQIAVGSATLELREGDLIEKHSATGYGVAGGVGYELWVGDQWSLGVLVRAAMFDVEGRSSGTQWEHVARSLPSLLVTITDH